MARYFDLFQMSWTITWRMVGSWFILNYATGYVFGPALQSRPDWLPYLWVVAMLLPFAIQLLVVGPWIAHAMTSRPYRGFRASDPGFKVEIIRGREAR